MFKIFFNIMQTYALKNAFLWVTVEKLLTDIMWKL